MLKKKLLCDMDSIVVNIEKTWYGQYNADYHDDLSSARITEWAIDKFVKPECGMKIYSYLREPGFYFNMEPHEGAIEALKKIHESGKYEVFYCSKDKCGEWAASDKVRWANKYTPFIDNDHIIGIHFKEMVKADVIIDDAPHNLTKYRNAWPSSTVIAIDYPYNRTAHNACNLVALDYKNMGAAWREILRFLKVK